MEHKKSKVVKSKSSNAAAKNSLSKVKQKHKKSKSSASFKPLVKKQRGVYVEKKSILPKEESNLTIANDWASRKPKKDKKLFLPSVLTLLSKSSAGTQYLYSDVKYQKPIIKAVNNNKTDVDTDGNVVAKTERKLKYKSKILNSDSYIADQFEVIQSKKNVCNTPSLEHSDIGNIEEEDFDNIKWSKFLPRLVQPDKEEIQLEKDKKLSQLLKEVTEGRMNQPKQVKIDQEEPATLTMVNKDAPLAVNFVESMFSADNRSEGFTEQEFKSAASSKTRFEVDNRTCKLNFGTECSLHTSRLLHNHSNRNRNYEKIIDDYEFSKPLFKPRKHRHVRAASKKKHVSQSSNYQTTADYLQIKNKRKLPKKFKKRNLMNLLKKELSMDAQPFEEPQNLYQALKQIAKNKRKSQKTIRFDMSCVGDDNNDKCVFKRQKVISTNKRWKSKRKEGYDLSQSLSLRSNGFKDRKNSRYNPIFEEEVSNHSLEVFDPDYDSPWRRANYYT